MNLNEIEALAIKEALKLGLEIVSVEFVKEAGENILRILIDKDDGVNIHEAAALNEAISLELDVFDFKEDSYLLEVSSVGIERPIKTAKDYQSAVDCYIYLEFDDKCMYGYLKENNDSTIVVEENIKGQFRKRSIEKDKIKQIRLAIKF